MQLEQNKPEIVYNRYKHFYNIYNLLIKRYFCSDNTWLTEKTKSVINNLSKYSEKLNEPLENIRRTIRRKDQHCCIFVIGEGNFGKSSLINAILKQKLAEVDFLPKTWCIDIYKYGPQKVDFIFRDGFTQSLSYSEAKNKLEEIEKSNHSVLEEVVWYNDHINELKNFTIVDTPGLAQILCNKREKIDIEHYFDRADAVLWLLNSKKINSLPTEEFIKKLSPYSKKTIGVLNFWDTIQSSDDKNRVLSVAHDNFSSLVSEIIPVSCRYAMEGFQNNDLSKIKNSNIQYLKNKVENIYNNFNIKSKNIIIYNNVQILSNHVMTICKEENDSYINNLNLYKENIAIVNNTVSNCKSDLTNYIQTWSYDKLNRIQNNINSMTGVSLSYIKDQVIREDDLKSNSLLLQGEIENIFSRYMYFLKSSISTNKYVKNDYKINGTIFQQDILNSIDDIQNIEILSMKKLSLDNLYNGDFEKYCAYFVSLGNDLLGWVPGIGEMLKEKHESNLRQLRPKVKEYAKKWINEYKKNYFNQIIESNSNVSTVFKKSLKKEFDHYFENEYEVKNRISTILEYQNDLKSLSLLFTQSFLNIIDNYSVNN